MPAPRQTGFRDVLSDALALYRACFPIFFAPILGLYLALSFARLVIAIDMPASAEISVSLALELLVPVLLGGFVFGALAVVFRDAEIGRSTSFGAAFREVGAHPRSVLTLGLLGGAMVFIVLFAFGPFVTLVYPMFIGPPVFIQVAALEDAEGRVASLRARGLLSGHWGRAGLYLLSLTVLIALLSVAPASILSDVLAGRVADLVVAAVFLATQGLAWALTLPLLAAAGFVLYTDLRARKEELDLDELRKEATTAPAAPVG